jgi:hypothetical protein
MAYSDAVTVKIDLGNFKLEALGRDILSAFSRAIKQQMYEVVRLAKKQHRYGHPYSQGYRPTHMLAKSVVQSTNQPPMQAEAHLETGIAYYAPYVHEGHGTHKMHAPIYYSWKPERFLYEAFSQKEPMMQYDIEQFVRDAIDGKSHLTTFAGEF